jgi:hypothetical protein
MRCTAQMGGRWERRVQGKTTHGAVDEGCAALTRIGWGATAIEKGVIDFGFRSPDIFRWLYFRSALCTDQLTLLGRLYLFGKIRNSSFAPFHADECRRLNYLQSDCHPFHFRFMDESLSFPGNCPIREIRAGQLYPVCASG